VRRYTLKIERPAARSSVFLDELNEQQRRVAASVEGPMLVIAGAGTGKTRTLVYRTAHLIETGTDPDRILLVTFTNKAAREMIDRVGRLVPARAERIWAGTFHAIARRILRRHAERLGYGNNFGIINMQEARDLMSATIGEVGAPTSGPRFPKPDVLLSMLSTSVNTAQPLLTVIEADYPQFTALAGRIDEVLTRYLGHKVEMNLMDYDDLLVNLRMLFEDHPEVHARYAEQFEHVMVDEYQDTNRLQAAIVHRFAARHGNLMVVGDDCQSIYGFRGAEVTNILEFPGTCAEAGRPASTFRLEINYRSTPDILSVANASIRHNRRQFEKSLRATREAREKPAFVSLADTEQQAAFVAQRVLELRDEGIELRNQAVLYRAHYQAMELQLELQRRGIPFIVRGGMRFFEQAHIRDLLAYLKILFNPSDRLAWMRVLKMHDGIGNTLAVRIIEKLVDTGDPWRALQYGGIAAELPKRARRGYEQARGTLTQLGHPSMTGNPSAMFDFLLEQGFEGYLRQHHANAEQRVEDVRQLGAFAGQFDHYESFLEELALVENVSAEDLKGGGTPDEHLLLSTVHQAKGLEWEAVFMICLADGQFPLGRALSTEEEIEEERRLFYVAVTRARSDLYLCCPQWGTARDRSRVMLRPSRFLAELPVRDPELCETWQIAESRA
jgi:DNA helicase-2/ATP-dependent DNA helicase PcrA